MEITQTIDSYRKSFASPLGAYIYMLLNQTTPEFFVINSQNHNELGEKLEKILRTSKDIETVIKEINLLPEQFFKELYDNTSRENDLSKDKVIQNIKNIKYLDLEFDKDESWNLLSGFIQYNNYTEFIDNKSDLLSILKEQSSKFSMRSMSLNPNFSPFKFLKDFEENINIMCEALDIKPKQIGLNILSMNYKTEKGDFTGYVSRDYSHKIESKIDIHRKMVINKTEVFAHEWMHFIENALAFQGHTFTSIMDTISVKDAKDVFPEYNSLFDFKSVVNEKNEDYSDKTFVQTIKSSSQFFENFALNHAQFYINIEEIAQKFQDNYKNGINDETCIKEMETSISNLLNEEHPTRYFSFIKAQCELYIDKENNKKLEKNQFIDFAKKSDVHLKLDNYTQSTEEIFARSFEAYLYEKLTKMNKKCSLVASEYHSDFYPQGKTQEKLSSLWDKMWEQLRNALNETSPVNDTVSSKNDQFKLSAMNNINRIRETMKENKKHSLKNI